jgi:glycerol-3-phosphate dehydrogenase
LILPLGGKLTSARADAAILVDRAEALLGRRPRPSATAARPLPWAPTGDWRAWSSGTVRRALRLGLDEETIESCLLRYGTRTERVLDRVAEAPHLGQRIAPDAPFCLAEAAHAVIDEMARSLEDVLRRRVPLLLLSRLSAPDVERVARLAGEILRWSSERCEREIASLASGPTPAVHETV